MLFRLTVFLVAGLSLGEVTALAGPYAPAPSNSPGSAGNPDIANNGSPAISVYSSSILEWASGATIVRGLRNVENSTEYSSNPSSAMNFAFYGGSDGASAAASAASVAAGGSAIASTANTAPIGQPFVGGVSSYDAVALGQNGTATLTFTDPITMSGGYDFAVFNNGFSNGSLEWVKPALVSVSSDGVHFFSFPSVSLTPTTAQESNYAELDPTNLYDIAGKDPQGWGTPFALSELAAIPADADSPYLNLDDITEVRITSVSGDINSAFASLDSEGNIINSPWPAPATAGSEGFDLAGVGVLSEAVAPEPASLSILAIVGAGVLLSRQRRPVRRA
jgi:hypothetical protein